MKYFWKSFLGTLHKELSLQSRFRLAFFTRLLVGPFISVFMTAILLGGFFASNPTHSVGGLNKQTYTSFLLLGAIAHTFLNSGYYVLSSRLMTEWWTRTLVQMWTSPSPFFSKLLGLSTLEFIRCNLIMTFLLGILLWKYSLPPLSLLYLLVLYYFIFAFGILLGLFRSALFLINEGKADILDNFYLLFVFTSCLYIPLDLLPKALQTLCTFNPIYWLMYLIRSEGNIKYPFLTVPIVFFVALYLLLHWIWIRYEHTIAERASL